MKHTKIFMIVLVLFIAFGGAAALFAGDEPEGYIGDGPYADFNQLMYEVLDVSYTFIEEMDAAQSGTEVAAAIRDFAGAMNELEPRMDAMDEKYPDIDNTNFPEELADTMTQYAEMTAGFETAMMKMFEYMDDPEVMDAVQLMQ